MLWIENYQGLEVHIDKPDALPDVNFELFDDKYNKVLEENISLRDFMKDLVINGDILKQAKKRRLDLINQAI